MLADLSITKFYENPIEVLVELFLANGRIYGETDINKRVIVTLCQ
jgi:hypothetical protein